MAIAESSPIYDDLMRFKPEGMTPNAWAVAAGVSRTVWADMRRHGNPSRRTLEKLLAAAGSSLAEFEALRISETSSPPPRAAAGFSDHRSHSWGRPQLPALPLVRTVLAGQWGNPESRIELIELHSGEFVDRVPRPVSLANDATAYAVTIVGDSMWPRFRPGRHVAVSARAPIAVGDDVLVKLNAGAAKGATPVLIKELVRKSGSDVELRQFNPDVTFRIRASEVASIEKILGELV
jgi:SOS-response transcriptional repressor LexA